MQNSVEACVIAEDCTLLSALRIIEHGGMGIALLVDHDSRLIGTLTDGDIRRALIGGASLDGSARTYCRAHSTVVDGNCPRADVLDLMQSLLIHQIPVVDEAGRVVGLHLLHKVIGLTERPNIAVIMAGGRGARLGELTQFTAKPMLRVAGRPILERLVLHLVGHGIRRVYISVHYLAETIKAHFGDGKDYGCKIEYLEEKEPMGTGGCLSLLPGQLDQDIIVCNGDLVTQVDFASMLRFHSTGQYAVTVGASPYTHTVPFGVLRRDGGRLDAIEEKPVVGFEVNAGVYVLSPDVVKQIPAGFRPDALSAFFKSRRSGST